MNKKKKSHTFNLSDIATDIQHELENFSETKAPTSVDDSEYVKTGIEGFDKLMSKGIPKGSNVLVSGGPGSGKTIFCLQLLSYHASKGKKCLLLVLKNQQND